MSSETGPDVSRPAPPPEGARTSNPQDLAQSLRAAATRASQAASAAAARMSGASASSGAAGAPPRRDRAADRARLSMPAVDAPPPPSATVRSASGSTPPQPPGAPVRSASGSTALPPAVDPWARPAAPKPTPREDGDRPADETTTRAVPVRTTGPTAPVAQPHPTVPTPQPHPTVPTPPPAATRVVTPVEPRVEPRVEPADRPSVDGEAARTVDPRPQARTAAPVEPSPRPANPMPVAGAAAAAAAGAAAGATAAGAPTQLAPPPGRSGGPGGDPAGTGSRTGSPVAAARAATGTRPAAAQRHPARIRKARLRLLRVDPWSVMKTAFLLSIAAGAMLVVALGVLWSVLDAAGVFSQVGNVVRDVTSSESSPGFSVEEYLGFSRVMGFGTLIAVIDIVLITALATLGAFLYNLSASLLGGLEVTLAEDD